MKNLQSGKWLELHDIKQWMLNIETTNLFYFLIQPKNWILTKHEENQLKYYSWGIFAEYTEMLTTRTELNQIYRFG